MGNEAEMVFHTIWEEIEKLENRINNRFDKKESLISSMSK